MSRSCTSRLSRRSRTRSKSRGSRRGRMSMSARSAAARSAKRARRGQRQDGRVRADFGIEVPANPPERLVQLDGVQIATAFVEHVARDRRQAGPLARIRGRADRQQHQEADERNGVLLDGPHAQAVAERPAADFGKLECRVGAERGKLRAIDRHQDTATERESPSASPTRPLGTTLNATRPSGRSHSRAARCIAPGVTRR